jgi:hypothetical protein
LQFGQRLREFVHHFDIQFAGLQGRRQFGVPGRIAGNDQHARIAAHGGEGGGVIVLRDGVAGRVQLHVVLVKARLGQGLGEGEKVFARVQLHLLFAQRAVVEIEADGGRLRLVGLGENFTSKVCPFLTVVGRVNFRIETSLPRLVPNGTTSRLTPSGSAAARADMASPTFSFPSDSSTSRFWPVSGKAAVPRRMALAMSVRSTPDHGLDLAQIDSANWAGFQWRHRAENQTPAVSLAFWPWKIG